MKVQRHHAAFKFDQGTEVKSESWERRESACESHRGEGRKKKTGRF